MITWIPLIIVGAFVLLTVYLFLGQRRLMFAPTREIAGTPADIGLACRDVFLDTEDGLKINAWYLRSTPDSNTVVPRKTVLFFHGNAGNMSHRLTTMEFLVGLGVDVLMIDYRGYGRSEGSPGEDGLYADAVAAYDWLTAEHAVAAEDIVVFGRSLGGAVAVELALRRPCSGVIVESAFTSMTDMGRKLFPYVPIRILLRHHFETIEKIDRLSCPVLIAHSPDDELVPYEMGRRLYEAAPEPKRFAELSGGHNELGYFEDPNYRKALKELIDHHFPQ